MLGELEHAVQVRAEEVRHLSHDQPTEEVGHGLERAAAIYFQVGRRRQEAGDIENAIASLRKALQAYPMVPALKRVVAHFHNDPDWGAVRPPMVPLDPVQSSALIADLARLGFTLGERRRSMAA